MKPIPHNVQAGPCPAPGTRMVPKFSVIVPVYNVERYLSKCVKSVVEQPGPPDWECILVDDGSTDTGAKMCDVFAEECPGVQVIHEENQGLAAARNAGLAAAVGEWVLFLDSDDYWPADFLPNLRAALSANPGFDWYVGRYVELDETGRLHTPAEVDFRPGVVETDDYSARVAELYDRAHWSVWKYCLRRSFLQAYGLTFWPSVVWAEDYPFDLQLLRFCHRLCFLDVTFTVYRANRAGSLLNSGLPKHFTGILAAMLCFAYEFSRGECSDTEEQEILRQLGNVFWPQARAAAVRDKELRNDCALLVSRCRPLYDWGEQCHGRADWVAFRWMMKLFGARFALWAASRLHRSGE